MSDVDRRRYCRQLAAEAVQAFGPIGSGSLGSSLAVIDDDTRRKNTEAMKYAHSFRRLGKQ